MKDFTLNDLDKSILSSVFSIVTAVESISIGFEMQKIFDKDGNWVMCEGTLSVNDEEVLLFYNNIQDIVKDYEALTSVIIHPYSSDYPKYTMSS